MIHLRHIALAAALLLGTTAYAMADPMSDVHEATADVFAEVSNLQVLEPSGRREEVTPWEDKEERLVEGHTTFVTLEMTSRIVRVEGNVTVTGYVKCEPTVDATTTELGRLYIPRVGTISIPIPTGVREASIECHAAGRVIITPTVYCQLQGDYQCGTSTMPLMYSTGRILPFTAPDGTVAELEELTFSAPAEDGLPRDYYAWAVPMVTPWVAEDGTLRNMLAPIPLDSLRSMGIDDFHVLWESGVNRA